MTSRLSISLAATVAALAPAAAALGTGYSFRLVTSSGDIAPSSLGGHFLTFGWPRMNSSGQVAFVAKSDGGISETGMWWTDFEDPQTVALIVGQDFPVPGAPGKHFGTFDPSLHHPLMNDDGNVGFAAPVTIGAGNTGVFRLIDGTITKVALPNDAVPGLPVGTTFEYVGNLIAFNAYNLVAFDAVLEGRGIGASNNQALFLTWFGGLNMVTREGNGAPGLPGTTFGPYWLAFPLLADNGQIAFDLPLNGAQAAQWSRWRGWPGALELIAKEADPTPVGGTFTDSYDGFWSMALPANGATFVERFLVDGGSAMGLWSFDDGELMALAYTGQLGPIGFYEEFSEAPPATSADGTVAFVARFGWLGLPDTKDSAVLRRTPQGAVSVVLREGDQAVGYGPGIEVDDTLVFGQSTPLEMADSHWLLVAGRVRGPGINIDNNRAYWAVSPEGTIHHLCHEGQWVSLPGHPARQVKEVRVALGNGMHTGRRGGLNERGDVALALRFTNLEEAVVVAQRGEDCPGDLDGDGVVGPQDLGMLLGDWGNTGPVGTGGDVDWDGDTDAADLGALLGGWGPCS